MLQNHHFLLIYDYGNHLVKSKFHTKENSFHFHTHRRFFYQRQNPAFIKVLTQLTHANNPENVIVSHDRFTIYRATITEEDEEAKKKEEFSTGDRNLHLDLNPWWWQEDSADIKTGINNIQYTDPQVIIHNLFFSN